MLLTLRYLLTFLTVILFIAVVIYVRFPFSDTKTMIRYFFRQKKQNFRLPKEEVAHLYHLNKKISVEQTVVSVPEKLKEPENRDILGRVSSVNQTETVNSLASIEAMDEQDQSELALMSKRIPIVETDSLMPISPQKPLLINDALWLDLAQIERNLKKSHPKHASLAPLNPARDLSSLPLLSHEEIKANLRHLERRKRLRTPSTMIPEVEFVHIQEPEKPVHSRRVVHRLSESLLAPKKEPRTTSSSSAFSAELAAKKSLGATVSHQNTEIKSSSVASQLPVHPNWGSHRTTTLIQTVNPKEWSQTQFLSLSPVKSAVFLDNSTPRPSLPFSEPSAA
ncbi:MAG: hypothetical protein K2P98_01665, partial [Neisseriaceae bacterium]|nr:hypothetical protein [Neisseriaceae bacterium]